MGGTPPARGERAEDGVPAGGASSGSAARGEPGAGSQQLPGGGTRGMPAAALTGSPLQPPPADAGEAGGSRGEPGGAEHPRSASPPRPARSREAFGPAGRGGSPWKRCFVRLFPPPPEFNAFKPVLPNTGQLQGHGGRTARDKAPKKAAFGFPAAESRGVRCSSAEPTR